MSNKTDETIVGAAGCMGCFIVLCYAIFYGALATLVVWLLLYAFNIVERLPWQ